MKRRLFRHYFSWNVFRINQICTEHEFISQSLARFHALSIALRRLQPVFDTYLRPYLKAVSIFHQHERTKTPDVSAILCSKFFNTKLNLFIRNNDLFRFFDQSVYDSSKILAENLDWKSKNIYKLHFNSNETQLTPMTLLLRQLFIEICG